MAQKIRKAAGCLFETIKVYDVKKSLAQTLIAENFLLGNTAIKYVVNFPIDERGFTIGH